MRVQRVTKSSTELETIAKERLKVGNDETKGLIELNIEGKRTTALRTYKGIQIDENTVQCWKKDTMDDTEYKQCISNDEKEKNVALLKPWMVRFAVGYEKPNKKLIFQQCLNGHQCLTHSLLESIMGDQWETIKADAAGKQLLFYYRLS